MAASTDRHRAEVIETEIVNLEARLAHSTPTAILARIAIASYVLRTARSAPDQPTDIEGNQWHSTAARTPR